MSSSHSRSSIGSLSHSSEPEKHFEHDFLDNTFKEDTLEDIEVGKSDRRPSFANMQSEDNMRRPSVTVYQLEDSDHPDIKSIQDLVAGMTFGDSE